MLGRRWPVAELFLAPTLVQGDAAPPQIVAALQAIGRAGVDVVLLIRGGGSLEDLWAFNDAVSYTHLVRITPIALIVSTAPADRGTVDVGGPATAPYCGAHFVSMKVDFPAVVVLSLIHI